MIQILKEGAKLLSFSAVSFSWRMRLTHVKKHKFAFALIFFLLLAALLFGPSIYHESWLDPFSTLAVPDRQLKPHAITMLGIVDSNNSFHPSYYADVRKIQELLHNLQRATPLPASAQTFNSLINSKIQYYTLHRSPSNYHTEEDFALQYYPEKGIVRFGDQLFRINEATIYSLTTIYANRTSGWWK